MRVIHKTQGAGVVTTDHPASSFDQPVFIPLMDPNDVQNAAYMPVDHFDADLQDTKALLELGVGGGIPGGPWTEPPDEEDEDEEEEFDPKNLNAIDRYEQAPPLYEAMERHLRRAWEAAANGRWWDWEAVGQCYEAAIFEAEGEGCYAGLSPRGVPSLIAADPLDPKTTRWVTMPLPENYLHLPDGWSVFYGIAAGVVYGFTKCGKLF